MKTKLGLLGAAAVLALTLSPQAMAGEGWYISVAGGGVWVDDVDFVSVFDPTAAGSNSTTTSTFEVDPGIPIVKRTGGLLLFYRFEPGIFPGRLVEVAVYADVFVGA